MAPPRCFFLFFMLGLDSLQHIAGLGDVRQVDFGCNRLRRPRRPRRAMAGRLRSALEMLANLFRFVFFQRTGVRLALRHAQFCQYIQNLAALHFQLAREIVDSNLAHPPLFKICYPKPTSCS
jgi:hypothetical protein